MIDEKLIEGKERKPNNPWYGDPRLAVGETLAHPWTIFSSYNNREDIMYFLIKMEAIRMKELAKELQLSEEKIKSVYLNIPSHSLEIHGKIDGLYKSTYKSTTEDESLNLLEKIDLYVLSKIIKSDASIWKLFSYDLKKILPKLIESDYLNKIIQWDFLTGEEINLLDFLKIIKSDASIWKLFSYDLKKILPKLIEGGLLTETKDINRVRGLVFELLQTQDKRDWLRALDIMDVLIKSGIVTLQELNSVKERLVDLMKGPVKKIKVIQNQEEELRLRARAWEIAVPKLIESGLITHTDIRRSQNALFELLKLPVH